MSTVFVPVVLTEEQARAAANACAAVFVQLGAAGLAKSSDPLFAAALEIENALHKAGVLTLERHRREEPST